MSGERFRITIDVDENLYRRVYKAFEWGDRNKVMREVLDQVVSAVEAGGQIVTFYILSGRLPLFERENIEKVTK